MSGLQATRNLNLAASSRAADGSLSAVSKALCITRSDTTRDDLSGLSLGPYDLGRCLGRGGMGAVFIAKHRLLQRDFAVKFLSQELTPDRSAVDRFLAEVRTIGSLNHPNIVTASDAGFENGTHYLVTELLFGSDLAWLIQHHGPMPHKAAFWILTELADALEAAHAAGIIHRDIKPSNVFLTDEGRVKLLDFGIARSSATTGTRTQNNTLLGTIDFVSPEQAENASQAGIGSDIYSLGCTAVFLMSGEAPYPDRSHSSTLAKLRGHWNESPAWLTSSACRLTNDEHHCLTKMLAKQPDMRWADCRSLRNELLRFADAKALKIWLADKPTGKKTVESKIALAPRTNPAATSPPRFIRLAKTLAVAAVLVILIALTSRYIRPMENVGTTDSTVAVEEEPNDRPETGRLVATNHPITESSPSTDTSDELNRPSVYEMSEAKLRAQSKKSATRSFDDFRPWQYSSQTATPNHYVPTTKFPPK